MTTPIFVFGSNLAGRHGKGAALWAKDNRGAVYGVGVGRTGDAYAIPTKDENLRVLPLGIIYTYVGNFLHYAREHPELTFELTPIGCGLAGYSPKDIAPMFRGASSNVELPDEFTAVLGPPPADRSLGQVLCEAFYDRHATVVRSVAWEGYSAIGHAEWERAAEAFLAELRRLGHV